MSGWSGGRNCRRRRRARPPDHRRPHRMVAAALAAMLMASLVACAPLARTGAPAGTTATGGVPPARLARLARCVDVARWFWEVTDYSATHFTTYMTDGDLSFLHHLGFTCVRLSIDPNLLYHKATPDVPDATFLAYVDAAAKRLIAHDLAVIIDLHDDPDKPLEQDPDYAAGFIPFWGALARHFRDWNASMLFLEVLNEPVFQQTPTRWLPIQQRLLAAMRAGAPQLTLIATGPLWSSVAGLLLVRPVAQRNVVYTFHFYDPTTFTHQGAAWWVNGLDRYVRDLPFPVTTTRCASAVARFTNADVRASAEGYCAGHWDAAKIDALVAQAAAWSSRYHVPVIAGEFGAYCAYTPPTDRLAWFRAVHSALSRYDIGWNLWAYDDCYGLNRQVDDRGHISIDQGVVDVLGLNKTAHGATASNS